MVKAELKYNPYILETEVMFNEAKPHVNSMVEKYQNGLLADWIEKIPNIFYNELNGYDFDLEFTGTKFDYDELKSVFEHAGIAEDDVRLYHVSELSPRSEKMNKIEELIDWLRCNTNENLDVETFLSDNTELFNDSFPLIIMQDEESENPEVNLDDVSVEIISDCSEVSGTNLYHTPIIFRINKNKLNDLIYSLRALMMRKDVCEKQLFFLTDSSIKDSEFNHFFKELGMDKPNIIKSFDDQKISDYMNRYPISDYIYDAINAFTKVTLAITDEFNEKDQLSKKTNSKAKKDILMIDKKIDEMKESASRFDVHKTLAPIDAFDDRAKRLQTQIAAWNNRRTVISNKHEAERLADEYVRICERAFYSFASDIGIIAYDRKLLINNRMNEHYKTSGLDDKFIPETCMGDVERTIVPNFRKELLKLKEERFVKVNKGGIFQSKDEIEMVKETNYYYKDWKKYASELLTNLSSEVISNHNSMLNTYLQNERKEFFGHLTNEIEKKTLERTALAQQLSDDEKKMQLDMEWLEQFKDKLRIIERG